MAWRGVDHRVENTVLAVLAVLVALTVAYALLTRPQAGTSNEAEFERTMPENYKPVLAALVRASGHACDKICTASIVEPQLDTSHVRVACTVEAKDKTCDRSSEYNITIAPAVPEPSR